MIKNKEKEAALKRSLEKDEVLRDYELAHQSRLTSLIGRREVLSGKAKFGIFGDGKEVAQVAMAKAFRHGDFRSGYYRDQTLMFALGLSTIQEFFAQLYAHADVILEPSTAGRQMNGHFGTRLLDEVGQWRSQQENYNSSADTSPTGSQMPRLVGLAYASKLYRELESLRQFDQFSDGGNEIAFGTIGNASTAEGMFWEAINAVGVLKAPLLLSIWDDGYGISVPNEFQMTKGNISALLEGFRRDDEGSDGYELFTVEGWNYPLLVETYQQAAAIARRDHVPVIIHVTEMTQPQGHSTSGSHERYKTAERLEYEEKYDCLARMRAWMIGEGFATDEELKAMEAANKKVVEGIRRKAWKAYIDPIRNEVNAAADIMKRSCAGTSKARELQEIRKRLLRVQSPFRKHVLEAIRDALVALRAEEHPCRRELIAQKERLLQEGRERYNTHLYSVSDGSALQVPEVKAVYAPDARLVPGFELINKGFDLMLEREPRLIAFGEDIGVLGDVNQGFAGLQDKYGPLRVTDTGIRELTIVGQAIGMALRGLRPLAEIQYLDYLLYALQIMSDDLATLQWRTRGGQKAPVIIRTRGHRLEGVWHSGSPMASVINLVRGMRVLVPRNMTQALGFYNTLLLSDEPGLVVEVLNGYRLKEKLPKNLGEFTVPVGVPEVIREGEDVTVVTYGALCRIALGAAALLDEVGIDVELIDVQSLLPFDINGRILKSLKKTGRILFVDEDVPGGTTAYMMQQVIEKQGGFWWLDAEPQTLTAQAHRPAYGSDGDFWSKPNAEDIFESVYEMMNEADPARYPIFYR